MFLRTCKINRAKKNLKTLVCALLATIFFYQISLSEDSENNIIVYLEIPQNVHDEVILNISSVELNGYDKPIVLNNQKPIISSLKNNNQQLLLVDQIIKNDAFNTIKIHINEVVGYISTIPVRPELQSKTIEVQVRPEVFSKNVLFVNLVWQTEPIDTDNKLYSVGIVQQNVKTGNVGQVAYISNEESNSISIMNIETGRVVGVLNGGLSPREMIYISSLQQLVVAHAESNLLSVIDLLSGTIINDIQLRFNDNPSRLALSYDENSLYALNYGSSTLSVIDVRSLQEIIRTDAGDNPVDIAVNQINGNVYISDNYLNEVLIFNPVEKTSSNKLITDFPIGEILFDAKTNYLFLAGAGNRIVNKFDLQNNFDMDKISLCHVATGMAFNPFNNKLYVSVGQCHEIFIYHQSIKQEVGRIELQSAPGYITFDRDFRTLAVCLPQTGQLVLCNANSGIIEKVVEIGQKPYSVVIPW